MITKVNNERTGETHNSYFRLFGLAVQPPRPWMAEFPGIHKRCEIRMETSSAGNGSIENRLTQIDGEGRQHRQTPGANESTVSPSWRRVRADERKTEMELFGANEGAACGRMSNGGMRYLPFRNFIHLSQTEAHNLMREMLSGSMDTDGIAEVLAYLRRKGETVAELVGFASAMREA